MLNIRVREMAVAIAARRCVAVITMVVAGIAGCGADTSTPDVPPVATEAVDSGDLDPNVLAALEAAVRNEPFADDLHPVTKRTGRTMSMLQRAFDVRHYVLDLRVMPATRSIEGRVDITFDALETLDAIELDLDPDLDIRSAQRGNVTLEVTRDENAFVVALPATAAAGSRTTVSIVYGGQPHIALAPPWHGGFVWSEVDGTPWFATAVQGEGCDLWWPCKDTFADKPDDGVVVSISAPRGVKVASVGTLEGVTEGDDGFDTWRWTSRHPYAGYAIAINGGPFELVESDYDGVNGTTYPVQFWALPENADKAQKLVATDVFPDLEFFERLLGPYPWGDEKVGFVETPHLGMEHQTINGYGEQYKRGRHGFDQLLHHELAHEWFGNVMTHGRAEDAWIHEGYAAYMQSVYAEETVGRMGYFARMYGAYEGNEHCLPVVNSRAADVGEVFENGDIYTKGAWMLHTLRNYVGEAAFWAGTRRLIFDTAEPWSLSYPIQSRYRTTEDFIRIMSDEAGEDVAWLVETYLREVGMPKLESSNEDGVLSLRWNAPGNRAFPMPVEVSVDGDIEVVQVGAEGGTLEVGRAARIVLDPNSKILRDLPIIGDCAEQSAADVDRRIERYTKMAKDYGWSRN